jgi:hypothetical protein
MLHEIIFRYSTFAAVWNGRLYILAVDYHRYFIGAICSDRLNKGKKISWEN